MFFTELYSSETRKLIERLINYVVYKVILLFLQLIKVVISLIFFIIESWLSDTLLLGATTLIRDPFSHLSLAFLLLMVEFIRWYVGLVFGNCS